MFIVKVSWDAVNQQFRLTDQKLANMFEDGDMCLLVVDFFPHGRPVALARLVGAAPPQTHH